MADRHTPEFGDGPDLKLDTVVIGNGPGNGNPLTDYERYAHNVVDEARDLARLVLRGADAANVFGEPLSLHCDIRDTGFKVIQ
ncbi:hypothetical protein [Streptomyces sp. NPDC056061]|uniref:hypothetical protein n=1 Tax=Streptomyces sp. NPDC056061 TaxID=3345700 RepID=UPI0035DF6F28